MPYLPVLLGLALFAAPALAQDSLIDRIQRGLDGAARGIKEVGRAAEDIIGPGLGLGESPGASFTETRSFSERYPVGPSPLISAVNEFGKITIVTWPERIVQVEAEIIVGAETAEGAAEIAGAIAIDVAHTEDQLEVRTQLPDTRGNSGPVVQTVNYTITVPAAASVITHNFFGDIEAVGVGGLLAIESQYGAVSLENILGPVRARAHGEFPFRARGLRQGGYFDLNGAQAEFSNVSGQLDVSNFRGAILLQNLGEEVKVNAANDSGPVRLVLSPEEKPDLIVTAIFSEIDSDVPLSRSTQSDRTVARRPNAGSGQRISIAATFGSVAIAQNTGVAESATLPAEGAKPFNDTTTRTETATPTTTLMLDTAPGDVVIEGSDTDTITVSATRIVWVPTAEKAEAALDALDIRVAKEDDTIRVETVATRDMATLDCSSWRIDLKILVPRTVPVELRAQSGRTSVTGLGGGVTVVQTRGGIAAEHNKGAVKLTNLNGAIEVESCSGPVEASTRYGDLSLTDIYGELIAQCVEGRTLIEAPRGPVTVRQSGGDVRILALEGVGGDYEVVVNEGSISMLMAGENDATLSLGANRGQIYSTIPINGSIEGNVREFHGRIRNGHHRVRLESNGGDIILDGPPRVASTDLAPLGSNPDVEITPLP